MASARMGGGQQSLSLDDGPLSLSLSPHSSACRVSDIQPELCDREYLYLLLSERLALKEAESTDAPSDRAAISSLSSTPLRHLTSEQPGKG